MNLLGPGWPLESSGETEAERLGSVSDSSRWTGLNVHIVLPFSPDVEYRGMERSLAAALAL